MLIIDRFEGNWAVIEFGNVTFNFPQALLPDEAREGDVLNIQVSVNKEKTAQLKAEQEQLAEKLFEE